MGWVRTTKGGETQKYDHEGGRFWIFPVTQTNARSCRRRIIRWELVDRQGDHETSGTLNECKRFAKAAL